MTTHSIAITVERDPEGNFWTMTCSCGVQESASTQRVARDEARFHRQDVARREAADESGAVLVIVAIVMVLLLGLSTLVVDLGLAHVQQVNQQNAADAAALAGYDALEASPNGSDQTAAVQAAEWYGDHNLRHPVPSWDGCDLPSDPAFQPATGGPKCITFNGNIVRVQIPTQYLPALFGSGLSSSKHAAAGTCAGAATPSEFAPIAFRSAAGGNGNGGHHGTTTTTAPPTITTTTVPPTTTTTAPTTTTTQPGNGHGGRVWVCKYVGQPDGSERLKGGQNPQSVARSASVGSWFKDGQDDSFVIGLDTGQPLVAELTQ